MLIMLMLYFINIHLLYDLWILSCVINKIIFAPCVEYACYQCIYYSLSYHSFIMIFEYTVIIVYWLKKKGEYRLTKLSFSSNHIYYFVFVNIMYFYQ